MNQPIPDTIKCVGVRFFVNRTGFSYFQEVVNLIMQLDGQLHQLYVTNKKTKTTI